MIPGSGRRTRRILQGWAARPLPSLPVCSMLSAGWLSGFLGTPSERLRCVRVGAPQTAAKACTLLFVPNAYCEHSSLPPQKLCEVAEWGRETKRFTVAAMPPPPTCQLSPRHRTLASLLGAADGGQNEE
jgi:hypothetical protein